jgi:hypothetical protein
MLYVKTIAVKATTTTITFILCATIAALPILDHVTVPPVVLPSGFLVSQVDVVASGNLLKCK